MSSISIKNLDYYHRKAVKPIRDAMLAESLQSMNMATGEVVTKETAEDGSETNVSKTILFK